MTQGEVGTQHIVLTTEDVAINGQLPTIVLYLTDVLHLAGITGNTGNGRLIEQVAGSIPVELRSNGQTTTEQRDIQSQVAGDGGLPLDILVGIAAGNAVVKLAISSGSRGKLRTARVAGRIQEAPQVIVDVVVTCQTEGCTEFQLVNPFHVLQELLLVDDPCTGNRGEVAPLLARRELRATVGTERS